MKLNGKDILKQPQPHFETFKALFTHGVLGLSHSGRPIWVMKVHVTASSWRGSPAVQKGCMILRLLYW